MLSTVPVARVGVRILSLSFIAKSRVGVLVKSSHTRRVHRVSVVPEGVVQFRVSWGIVRLNVLYRPIGRLLCRAIHIVLGRAWPVKAPRPLAGTEKRNVLLKVCIALVVRVVFSRLVSLTMPIAVQWHRAEEPHLIAFRRFVLVPLLVR